MDNFSVWYHHYVQQGMSPQDAAEAAHNAAQVADSRQATHRSENRRIPISAGETFMHVVMTVITFGLWLPIWVIRAARGRREYMR